MTAASLEYDPHAYFERVAPTYLDRWPDALMALSVPTALLRLTASEHAALSAHAAKPLPIPAAPTGASAPPSLPAAPVPAAASAPPVEQTHAQTLALLAARLHPLIAAHPDGAFVRLGSRSGKDAPYVAEHGLRRHSGSAAVASLGGSARLDHDLRLAAAVGYRPVIAVRPWLSIPRWSELRCFMFGRRLAGVSQYALGALHCPELLRHAVAIKRAVRAFFERFEAAAHLDDVIFDVFVAIEEGRVTVRLLELNPCLPSTGACLFSWDEPAGFDGSFRFI